MIGWLEIAIIVLILLVVFGARFLPALGRGAGKGFRMGREKGSEAAAKVAAKAEEIDTAQIARTAGEHVRDAREVRDSFRGTEEPPPEPREDTGSETPHKPEDGSP